MLIFNPSELITKPELLFGRKRDLEILINTIKSGTNRQVQGEKRFGKTCFLHCAKSILDNQGGFVTLYLDCKKLNRFKGTANFYRLLIAFIVSELTKRNLLYCEHTIKKFTISPCLDFEDTYERLIEVKDFRIEGIFEEIIPYYSDLFDIRLVLLLDEYEYLMTTILDNPQGFMLIRTLSDLPRLKGIKPLTYILSGSWSWIKMCTVTGSPELNNQGASIIYLGAIDGESFSSMVEYYSEKNELPIKTKTLLDYSGGIPYFAKKIVETIYLGDNNPSFNLLKEDFASISKNLEPDERRLLLNLCRKKSGNKSLCENLLERGILKESSGKFSINGYFFQEYIVNNLKDETQISEILTELVENIFEQIEKINLNFKNKGLGGYLFEPVTDEHSMRKEFRKECSNNGDFQVFINSIYRCIFERTAETNKVSRAIKLHRIPMCLKTHNFIVHIDSFRQNLIHQSSSREFKPNKNQLNRQDLYKIYIGKVTEPTDREFYTIQRKILDNFTSYLYDIEIEIS
jgi:hypothetical protein